MPDGRKIGQVTGVDIDPDGKSVWVFDRCGVKDCVDSESNMAQNPGFKRGVRIGSVKDGKVTAFIPEQAPPKEGTGAAANSWGECVAVDDAGNVYVGMYEAGTVERHVKK